MAWIEIGPGHPGGGHPGAPPKGKLYSHGHFAISLAAYKLLGCPAKVLVSIEPEREMIRLHPTTGDNADGFTMSGGGNAPNRIGIRKVARAYPQLLGEYVARPIDGGVEFLRGEEDD